MEFNNCTFSFDSENVTYFNVACTFRGCSFVNSAASVGSGKALFDSCIFTGYSTLNGGTPIVKASGSNPLYQISNCVYDDANDAIKSFYSVPGAEFAQYGGGMLNGVFVTYNKTAETIPALENFTALVGTDQPTTVYDAYMSNMYLWFNGVLKPIGV